MSKRYGFFATSVLMLALAGCGGDPCEEASNDLAEKCGADFDVAAFEMGCGMTDGDACKSCIDNAFSGTGLDPTGIATAAVCADIMNTCSDECFCPAGTICVQDSGPGPEDAGPGTDSGPIDTTCGAAGRIGGTCRSGTTCATGLTCEAELTSNPMTGAALTLGIFGIPSGTEDPENDGEYIAGADSDIPIGFGYGGGLCTQGCNFATQATPDDGCGSCATCSDDLGGSPAWGAVGITVHAFVESSSNSAGTRIFQGVCRLNCAYDPATNGGCAAGMTCDPGTNVCVEACVDDSQCNVGWGVSLSDGLVAYDSMQGGTCNTTTGRCTYTPPSGAGLNTECEENSDCPQPGFCMIGGRCATLACADSEGMLGGPGPDCTADHSLCIGFGGNNGSICVATCADADTDCFPGQGCSPFTTPLDNGDTGFCFGICDADSECRSEERCVEIREDDPETTGTDESLSTCQAICDPDPEDTTVVTDAVDCTEADSVCIQVEGEDYGTCEFINQICFDDEGCINGQACLVITDDQDTSTTDDDVNNLYGRCVDGCTANSDCGTGEYCKIQTDSTIGVCRAPDGDCSDSPRTATTMEIIQPLRGDNQCVPGQSCDSTGPADIGSCTGTVVMDDGGTPAVDAGTDGGTPAVDAGTDGGTTADAGVDGGGA